jgi:hypothetical protein
MPETSSTFRKSCRQSLWISNSEEIPVVLCIEPWANEIQLLTGNDYQVIFEGPEGEFPAVEWGKSRITLYGWSGSVAQVFLGGTELLSCATAVPKMPKR